MVVLITERRSARSKLPLIISYSLPSLSTRDFIWRHLVLSRSMAFWFLSENRKVSLSHRNSKRSSLLQFLPIASIKWSTWILTDILSKVPITKIRAFFNLVNVEFHNWSVMWAIPDKPRPVDCDFVFGKLQRILIVFYLASVARKRIWTWRWCLRSSCLNCPDRERSTPSGFRDPSNAANFQK